MQFPYLPRKAVLFKLRYKETILYQNSSHCVVVRINKQHVPFLGEGEKAATLI